MRIGSIVLCRESCNGEYTVTNCDGVYRVVAIRRNLIIIEVVSHKYLKSSIGNRYTVDKEHFYEKSVKLL